ncbi:MAG: DUF192 domain-containing protein [Actinomycetes bacterium]
MRKNSSPQSPSSREALTTGWLMLDDKVLASISSAKSRKARRIGLRGVERINTPLFLQPCRWVHTFGMKTPLSVLYINNGGEVVKIQELKKNRLPLPVVKARCVLEADADAPRRWNLHVGDVVEIRFAQDARVAS